MRSLIVTFNGPLMQSVQLRLLAPADDIEVFMLRPVIVRSIVTSVLVKQLDSLAASVTCRPRPTMEALLKQAFRHKGYHNVIPIIEEKTFYVTVETDILSPSQQGLTFLTGVMNDTRLLPERL